MQLELRRRMKTCLGLRNSCSRLGTRESRELQLPRFPVCHPVASRGGQSEQAFLDEDGLTWSVVSLKSVITFSNVHWRVWGEQSLSQNQHFLSAVLGIKILSAGISPQGMRTCYVQHLLHTHSETAGGTHWCDTFEATKLNPWFIFKAQRDDWTYAMNI